MFTFLNLRVFISLPHVYHYKLPFYSFVCDLKPPSQLKLQSNNSFCRLRHHYSAICHFISNQGHKSRHQLEESFNEMGKSLTDFQSCAKVWILLVHNVLVGFLKITSPLRIGGNWIFSNCQLSILYFSHFQHVTN